MARENRVGAGPGRPPRAPRRGAGDGGRAARRVERKFSRKRYAPRLVSPNQGRRPASGKGGKKGARGAAGQRSRCRCAAGAARLRRRCSSSSSWSSPSPRASATRASPPATSPWSRTRPATSATSAKRNSTRSLKQSAAQSSKKEVPKPGDPEYKELMEAALGSLLDSAWLRGEAAEEGFSVTKAEVEKEFKKLKKENFKTEAEYKKFLKNRASPRPTSTNGSNSRSSARRSRKGSPKAPRHRARAKSKTITTPRSPPSSRSPKPATSASSSTKTKPKPNRRWQTSKSDNSPKNWKKVASKYSEDELSKSKGGFQKGIAEGVLEEPLNEEVFSAAERTGRRAWSRPNAATTSSKSKTRPRKPPRN